ncbi:pleckstrin-2 [Callorhinchus milii]|uniref:Pleckstrin 2 n=1 Tax=Callorhinchus milii TaxID=7868 RepID=A0A4W3I1F2_CALMI|nr:pleckstrin-2 [Callorhinchus milii]|eukprot:gi/632942180/ref/XP_007886272.1/ PREDICTED: pleckstrin-2 [Callorhinchus milii]
MFHNNMQGMTTTIREGFLIKRGHIVQNWKARWFVLFKDQLLYYKIEEGKKESQPRGQIPLQSCTLICPCVDYENRPLMIKLKTQQSIEYFLQACSREERDSWAADINKVIKAVNPKQTQQLGTSFNSTSDISLNHLIDAMHDSHGGIKEMANTECGNTYKMTFTGSSVVDWVMSWNFAHSRLDAVTLASILVEENLITPVGPKSTKSVRSMPLGEQLMDDSTVLYCFIENKNKIDNSNDIIDINPLEMSGKIVKQGYLMKQGHTRKNWKVRKFVLRAEPAYLHYYDPCKEKEDHAAGGFALRGCLVSAVEDNGIAPGIKGKVQGNLFKIITIHDVHYYIQTGSPAERSAWIKAIKQLT